MPDWGQVLSEIKEEDINLIRRNFSSRDTVRRKHLKALSEYTGRNTICYYSGWLSKPYVFGMDITDEDKNGFMMAIHGMDKSKGLDLLLHTPGGSISAAESLVHYLKQIFGNDVRAVVPQLAMSAGTMIACSCKSILMAKHSNLGPIDPQIAGTPAAAVKEEFENAIAEITQNGARLQGWQFILSKYTPTFLATCENAIKLSKEFVKRELVGNMLALDPNKNMVADNIVDTLSDFSGNKSHDRHIHADECRALGLVVEELEKDNSLQDKVLTVHHCMMHTLANSPAIKIIENDMGAAFIKN
jgi:ATP-dependent protease ClpP protease subunit